MKTFNELSPNQIEALVNEFELLELTGIPKPGSRKWYLLEFTHWLLGEILAGRNPI